MPVNTPDNTSAHYTKNNKENTGSMFKTYANRYKYMFIGLITLCVAATYFYLHYTESSYQASCVVFITDSTKHNVAEQEIQQHIRALQSGNLIQSAVNSSEFRSKYGKGNNSTTEFLIKRYGRQLNVAPGFQPGSIAISLTDNNKDRLQLFLNNLLSRYQQQYRSIKANDATIKLLDDSLRTLANQFVAANSLTDSADNHMQIIKKRVVYQTAVKVKQQNKLPDARQKAAFAVILNYINKPISSFVIIPNSFTPRSSALQSLIDSFNKAQLNKQSVIGDQQHTPASLSAANNRIIDLRGRIKQYIITAQTAVNKHLATSVTKVKYVTDTISRQQNSSTTIKNNRDIILKQIAAIKTRINNLIVPPYGSDADIINTSSFDITPVQPQAPLFYLAAMLIAVIICAVIIYARQKTAA